MLSKIAPQLSELRQENSNLQKERDALVAKYQSPEVQEREKKLLLREKSFLELIDTLQESTRKESMRTVLERYVCVYVCVCVLYIYIYIFFFLF